MAALDTVGDSAQAGSRCHEGLLEASERVAWGVGGSGSWCAFSVSYVASS